MQGGVTQNGVEPHANDVGTLAVLQYQVGTMKESLDRGLGGLEKLIDRGFDQVGNRLDKVETEMKTIQERQAFDAARLKALEEFRKEVEGRTAEQARQSEASLRLAREGATEWLIVRRVAIAVGGIAAAAASIAGTVSLFT